MHDEPTTLYLSKLAKCYEFSLANAPQKLAYGYITIHVATAPSLLPNNQAGLANHWPVFEGLSWC